MGDEVTEMKKQVGVEADFRQTAPAAHREGISAADATDPATDADGIDCESFLEAWIDITLASGSLTSMTVQALFWNSRTSEWMHGATRTITELPTAVVVNVRGGKLYMKVTALTGTSPVIDMDYTRS